MHITILNGFRVALVSFATNAFVRFDFLASFDKNTVKSNILSAVYQATGTNTGRALDLARTALLTLSAGYRGGKAVVIVVTDGQTQETATVLSTAANSIQQVAEVFAVGVGQDVVLSELAVIASAPSSSHVYKIGRAHV